MGGDASKIDRSATHQNADRSMSQADPLQPTKYLNGMAPSARQHPSDSKGRSSIGNPPGDTTAAQNALKRSRDEFERDGYTQDRRSRSRTPPYLSKNARTDHYSPPAAHLAVSPPNTRHAFVPDRGDKGSPNLDRRHEPPIRSPKPVYRHGRLDNWSPPMRRSSPVRRQSPSRQPSPPQREYPNPTDRPKAELHSSSPVHNRRDGESSDLPQFKNLSWKPPRLPSRQNSDSVVPRARASGSSNGVVSPDQATLHRLSTDNPPERVKFNGVEGVPTGPKRGVKPVPLSPKSERTLPLDVGGNVKQRPHIFIAMEVLPAKKATIKHLHGCLSKFVLKESDIAVDHRGYYLLFENTVNGLKRLKLCYNTKCGAKLFGQYSLHMVCRPEGVTDTGACGLHDTVSIDAAAVPSLNAAASAQAFFDDLDFSQQAKPVFKDQKATDLRSLSREVAGVSGTMAQPHTDTNSLPARHSSPLRVPSRQDKEETSSSISGFTGSDSSNTKQSKCHMCKETQFSDADSLIQCSSCPRRYHRRCHTQPPIPSNMEPNHSWQCRRCLKKQVRPKSRLSNASFASSLSPAPSVGQPEERPTKKPRIDDAVPTMTTDLGGDDATSTLAGAVGSREESCCESQAQSEFYPKPRVMLINSYHIPELTPINSDDRQFHEAENLVKRSFSASVSSKSGGVKSDKPGRPTFVRKKISPPDPSTTDGVSSARAEMTAPATRERATAEADIEPQEDIDLARSSRKSHKWAGVGADKHIIQAGTETFFSADYSSRNAESFAQGGDVDVEPANETAVTGLEIPGSPKVPDGSNGHNGSADGDARLLKETTAVKLKLKLKASASTGAQNNKLQDFARRQLGIPRMKPSNPAVDKCTKCGKTIAFNPSGNKLCSRCKKDMSVDSGPAFTRPTDSTTEQPVEVSTDPERLAHGNHQDHHTTETAGSKNASSADPDAVAASGTPRLFPTPQSQHSKERTACVPCRKNRRLRCIHREPILVERSTYVQHAQKSSQAVPKQMEDNDEFQDDLDLWNERSIHRPVRDDTNDQTLTADSAMIDDLKPNIETHNSLKERVHSSSSLSPPPREDNTATPTKTPTGGKKRQSHTTVATSQYDLGNSFVRPKNTYTKLIGMALCATPGHSLRTQEIWRWVAENIPTYEIGKGNKWENGISATLSMKQQREELGIRGLWKKIEEEGAKKNQACWYALHPEQVDKMLQWDPVLKEPVSPNGARQSRRRESKDEDLASEVDEESATADNQEQAQGAENLSGCTTYTGSVSKPKWEGQEEVRSEPVVSDPMDVDDAEEGAAIEAANIRDEISDLLEEHVAESSDEEPIVSSRRRVVSAPTKATAQASEQQATSKVATGAMEIDKSNGFNEVMHAKRIASAVRHHKEPVRTVDVLSLARDDRLTLAQLIKADAEHLDFSAKSLFDEWPEYDPTNQFDREAKLAEIKRRPTRKQKWGQSSRDPWLELNPTRLANRTVSLGSSRSSLTLERTSRSMRNAAVDPYYPWENGEANVKHFDSVEALVQDIMPNNAIPIIHEGRIAYRDGTRNPFDGTLPRAKHIYKTGYA